MSAGRDVVRIDVGTREEGVVRFIGDNGDGFGTRHAVKLFGVLQRLHHAGDAEGTEVGQSPVQRITRLYWDYEWAAPAPACFFTIRRVCREEPTADLERLGYHSQADLSGGSSSGANDYLYDIK